MEGNFLWYKVTFYIDGITLTVALQNYIAKTWTFSLGAPIFAQD